MQAVRIMRTVRIVVAAVVFGLCGTAVIETVQHARAVDEMTGAARALLASLSDDQAEKATFAFDSEERSRHHFIPPEVFERHGMVYADMDFEQRVRALDLLRSPRAELQRLPDGAADHGGRGGSWASWWKARGAASRGARTSTWVLRVRDAGGRRHVGVALGRPSPLPALHDRGRGDHGEHADLPGRQSGHRAVRAAPRPAGDEGAGGHGPGAARLAQR